MVDDLKVLLVEVSPGAPRAEYADAVVERNILGKPTRKARELALRHLTTLYGLDPRVALFRALRRLWTVSEGGQSFLALLVALARDPLLRGTQAFILGKEPGTVVLRKDLEQELARANPERFSAASLKSFAQNVNGTWTSAGFLHGRNRKVRSVAVVTPAVLAMCLFFAHLEGLSGQRLFSSSWTKLLPGTLVEWEALASTAAHKGVLVFLNAAGVKEVRFPGFLSPEEEAIRQEAAHVV